MKENGKVWMVQMPGRNFLLYLQSFQSSLIARLPANNWRALAGKH